MNQQLDNILIVGGGTAGWMAAAMLGFLLENSKTKVQIIESEEIGTVGVGEATIPTIIEFNNMLGINEDEFIAATQATFKLGIEFQNWRQLGDSYIHPFGDFGVDFDSTPFYQYWANLYSQGKAEDLFEYSLMVQACRQNKFMRPLKDRPQSALSGINYAFQFDAGLYAAFLRKYAQAKGVERIEGKIEHVKQNADSGFIESVTTADHREYRADFFIDCSGFRGLLIEQTLKTGYEDWTRWLPCDRAVAIPCSSNEPPIPYTRATAREAGWQWRIPLQHRIGNGYVYCSQFLSDDEALHTLHTHLDGEALAEPNFIRFTAGRRKKVWNKNVLALGLAAGFMEPLESTSIHLVQTTLARLLAHFPDKRFVQDDIDTVNERTALEYERVRDFLVLHYSLTERTDTPFWKHCQTLERPLHLKRKLAQFKQSGRIFDEHLDLFSASSWLAVMYGQGLKPEGYHPITNKVEPTTLQQRITYIRQVIHDSLDYMPTHAEFIQRYCAAKKPDLL